jgi:hypothetical protein
MTLYDKLKADTRDLLASAEKNGATHPERLAILGRLRRDLGPVNLAEVQFLTISRMLDNHHILTADIAAGFNRWLKTDEPTGWPGLVTGGKAAPNEAPSAAPALAATPREGFLARIRHSNPRLWARMTARDARDKAEAKAKADAAKAAQHKATLAEIAAKTAAANRYVLPKPAPKPAPAKLPVSVPQMVLNLESAGQYGAAWALSDRLKKQHRTPELYAIHRRAQQLREKTTGTEMHDLVSLARRVSGTTVELASAIDAGALRPIETRGRTFRFSSDLLDAIEAVNRSNKTRP